MTSLSVNSEQCLKFQGLASVPLLPGLLIPLMCSRESPLALPGLPGISLFLPRFPRPASC
jgi:hypothetical protein